MQRKFNLPVYKVNMEILERRLFRETCFTSQSRSALRVVGVLMFSLHGALSD